MLVVSWCCGRGTGGPVPPLAGSRDVFAAVTGATPPPPAPTCVRETPIVYNTCCLRAALLTNPKVVPTD